MRIWSWTVEDWNAAFQIMTTIFVAGTVLTGVGAFFTGRKINERLAKELAAARASTAKVETDLAKQQERAANAERQLLEVQEKFRRRTLTQKDREKLVALSQAYLALVTKAKENGETCMIVYPNGDGEATEFANLLYHLFFHAGWRIQIHDAPYAEHTTGISIVVGDPKTLPMYAQVLQNVFREMKIETSVREEKDVNNKQTFLEVGSKH